MLKRSGLFLSALLTLAPMVSAQTTKPAAADPKMEIRASEAFNRGEFATALPMLQQVAAASKDDPKKLGSLNEQIRVCQKALDSLKNMPANGVDPNAPDVASAAETRKKHPAQKPGEVAEMTIKELGNFEYDDEKGGNIPADVKQMDGSTIRLHGYMIPMDQATNITQFALVPSLFSCCFGQPPQIQHTIVVNCPKGKTLAYCPDEIVVQGKLGVKEKKDDGYIVSIFEVSADSVKVAK
jgi:hypothetical protein